MLSAGEAVLLHANVSARSGPGDLQRFQAHHVCDGSADVLQGEPHLRSLVSRYAAIAGADHLIQLQDLVHC